jgi:hypothetical protein
MSRTTNHAKQPALLGYVSKHWAAKLRFGGSKQWVSMGEQVSDWLV